MFVKFKSVLFLLFGVLIRVQADIIEDNDNIHFMRSTYIVQCAQRKEISPCNCYQNLVKPRRITVECHKMNSFADVIQTLRNKFDRSVEIHLQIEFSKLDDLAHKKFGDIQSPIHGIGLIKNNMAVVDGVLPHSPFEGIDSVTNLMLTDSKINQFPGAIFAHMPNVETVTIERTFITTVSPADFKSLRKLRHLVIKTCNLTFIESDTFPPMLKWINLSENNISTLNNTLRNNTNLEYVILKNNNIESLEGQFADLETNTKLTWLDLAYNKLTSLPYSFKNLIAMKILDLPWNQITSLDNILKSMHQLTRLDLTGNSLEELSQDEFKECMALNNFSISLNSISNLNKSLLPLKSAEILNLTHNELEEFSIDEIIGLAKIQTLDLSFNKIKKFVGKLEKDTVIPETSVVHLKLEFNELEFLYGSLAEIKGLVHLNISHNKLRNIPITFLDGLQELKYLDVSYNYLHTLQNIAKATLPSLQDFYALFNDITELTREYDEGGFTAVCFMYLQYNKIEVINASFTEKNQCVYTPGVNATLYVYLEGNDVLCRYGSTEIIDKIESRNNTKIMGRCSSPEKRMEYKHANANDRAPIIVDVHGSTLVPKI